MADATERIAKRHRRLYVRDGDVVDGVLEGFIREEQDAKCIAEQFRYEVIGDQGWDIGDTMEARLCELIRRGRAVGDD